MNEREALDGREGEVLDVIRRLRRAHGRPVRHDEIAAGCRPPLFDRGASLKYVKELERKGYVRRLPGHGGVDLVDDPSGLPVVGLVAAGVPLPTLTEDMGRFSFHEEFAGDDLAVLRVRGASMVDAQIADGDWAIIRRDPQPETGAKVVCSIDGALTLKVLRRVKGEVWLYPCNRQMKAVRLREDENTFIVGVLVGIIRKC